MANTKQCILGCEWNPYKKFPIHYTVFLESLKVLSHEIKKAKEDTL